MIDNDVNLEGPGDSSSPENAALHTPPSGETDEFVPERDPDTGQVKPVPYDRFHQVNERYRSTRTDLEQAQHNLQLNQELSEQLRAQNQQYANLISQMHEAQQRQPVYQQPEVPQDPYGGPEYDPYEDPTDAKIRQMHAQVKQSRDALSQLQSQMESQSKEFGMYRQEQQTKALERQITTDIDSALREFPAANKYWMHNEMLRTGKHDSQTIRLLAKRSHEAQDSKRRDWARAQGYIEPPRKLMSSGPPAQQIQDLGDDLDAIEEAIRQRFGS